MLLLRGTEKMELKTKFPELNNFKAWWRIKDSIEFGRPVRCTKDWEYLQETLESGFMEEVPHSHDYTGHVRPMSPEEIAKYVWLKPTKLGLMCYELRRLLIEQQGETHKAYKQGKYDAISTLFSKMYELADIDPTEFEENDGD